MKQLENSSEKISEKDVVPITGLIVGRIVRMENELQTVCGFVCCFVICFQVLEVWGQANLEDKQTQFIVKTKSGEV
jgi:hypothetical protein